MAVSGWTMGPGAASGGASGTGVGNQSFAGVEATGRKPNKPGTVAPATPFAFDPAPMDDAQFASAVKAAQDDASLYIDGYIAPYRAQATRFYRGDPFGNEEEGRSQIVMTDVRDTTLAMLPSLLRIFTSSEDAVSFDPNTADKIEQAEQQTDYVNHLFYNDNPGFAILYDAFKDALIRKTGVIKYRWDEDIEIYEMEFSDLSEGQLHILQDENEIEILEKKRKRDDDYEPPQNVFDMSTGAAATPAAAPFLYDVKVRRYRPRKKVTIECIPPEEFICARVTRDPYTSPYLGHRSIKTLSQLVAMGYDRDFLETIANVGDTFVLNYEAQTRNPAVNAFLQTPDINDPSAKKVTYVENYIRIDKDGDGIAELRRVCTIGVTVLHDEVIDEVPMVFFCPDPEPHVLIGNSVADQTMDLQLLKSNVIRGTLDSLAQSIHPRTAVVEGQVNLDDVLNVETGAVIRMRQPGMIQPFSEPFVGQAAMPIIEWIDNLRANRTGIVPATAGLDPDVLQSTTRAAVDAAIQGAQERTEMTARLFAENGLKPLMKGLLKLVCRHQDKPRTLRLRGKWVEVDPRAWDAMLDCKVNVALGRGDEQRRIQSLVMIAAKQEQIIQLLGPDNPLSDVSQYRNTLARITELMGYKDVNQFWKPVDMNAIRQQQAQNPAKPDPNMVLAQAQMLKAQADQQKVQSDHLLQTQRLQIEDARERDKMKMNSLVQLQQIEAQFGASMADRDTQQETSRANLLGDLLKHSTAEHNRVASEMSAREAEHQRYVADSAIDVHKHRIQLDQDQQLQREKLAHDMRKHQLTVANQQRKAGP